MPTITRKIQISFVVEDKKQLKELYNKIYKWQLIVQKAANRVATLSYIQENIKDLFYIEEGTKLKLADIDKDPDGFLTMSKANTTYQVLSKRYKGEAPMGMLSALNTVIRKTYDEERVAVSKGEKSLRSYRGNIPMPVRAADITKWVKNEDGSYSFFVYGTWFKTYFGKEFKVKDINKRNSTILGRVFDETLPKEKRYKFCDSSIQLKKEYNEETKKLETKMFLLAVFRFEKEAYEPDKEKVAQCFLSEEYPIYIKNDDGSIYTIGTQEEFTHRRKQIKEGLRRVKASAKYNEGGRGRRRKTSSADRFNSAEKNYIENKMHLYARMVVKYCLERGIGMVVLNNYEEVKDKTHKNTDESRLLLSTWSYYGLTEKLRYKLAIWNIELELK